MFLLINTAQPFLIFGGTALAMITGSGYYAVLAGFLARAFPGHVRYTGISLSYQLCSTLIGGTTPLAAQALLTVGGGSIWPAAGFYAVLLLVTTACVAALAQSSASRAAAD